MKYMILVLTSVLALAVAGELCAQTGGNGDADELELLKRAWEQHRQDKEDEKSPVTGNEVIDKLGKAAGQMRGAERGLAREDPGAETQKKQDEAVELLDELIEQAEEAQRKSDSQDGGSEKKQKPDSQPRESQEKPGLVDPSRSAEPAKPGSERKRELLRKAGRDEKKLRYGPTGKKSDPWNPRLSGSSAQKELREGVNEKRPPQKAELIDRYFKELLKERPGK